MNPAHQTFVASVPIRRLTTGLVFAAGARHWRMTPMEPDQGIAPCCDGYKPSVILDRRAWCRVVESNHVLSLFRRAQRHRTCSLGMEPATGIEPAASRLRGERATFSASLAFWSTREESNLALSPIRQP